MSRFILPDWDESEKATLTRMWAAGASAQQVADVLGRRSRSSVCGMVRRLKLAARPQRRAPPITRTTKPRARAKPPEAPQLVAVPLPRGRAWDALPDSAPVSLVDLEPGKCKWPIGDDRPYLFCGAPASDGKPYCQTHTVLSIGRGTESERAAHRAREKVHA